MNAVPFVVIGWTLAILLWLFASSSHQVQPKTITVIVPNATQPVIHLNRFDNLKSQILGNVTAARLYYSIGNTVMHSSPTWTCPIGQKLERMGPAYEGGKWVCLPPTAPPDCLVYSWGSNGDFGFEEAIHSRLPACEIHTFDCTINPPNKPAFVHYHEWCLLKDQQHSYRALVDKLNHTKRSPLVVKMDVEGYEWPFFAEYFDMPPALLRRIPQIVVEVHLFVSMPLPHRYQSVDLGISQRVQNQENGSHRVIAMLSLLSDWDKEFDLVAQEHNTERSPPHPPGVVSCATCFEYTLVRK